MQKFCNSAAIICLAIGTLYHYNEGHCKSPLTGITSEDHIAVSPEDPNTIDGIPPGMCRVAQVPSICRTIWVGFDNYTLAEGAEVIEYERREHPESRWCVVTHESDLHKIEKEMWLDIVRESNALANVVADFAWQGDPNSFIIRVPSDPNILTGSLAISEPNCAWAWTSTDSVASEPNSF